YSRATHGGTWAGPAQLARGLAIELRRSGPGAAMGRAAVGHHVAHHVATAAPDRDHPQAVAEVGDGDARVVAANTGRRESDRIRPRLPRLPDRRQLLAGVAAGLFPDHG